MSKRLLRPRRDVCQLCEFITLRQPSSIPTLRPRRPLNIRPISTASRNPPQKPPSSKAPATTAAPPRSSQKIARAPAEVPEIHHVVSQAELEGGLQRAKAISDKLLSFDRALSEAEATFLLNHCNTLAANFVSDTPSPTQAPRNGAASVLLSLDESSKTKQISLHKLPPSVRRMADELSKIAFSVVKHPNVFITPKILESYTKLQAKLGRPESFPEVFEMYANKLVPEEGSSPVKYGTQNPNKVANAIPLVAANRALQTAIDAKQLVVAMDIIDTSYTKPAFIRAKLVRKCLVPATALTVAPLAAWTVASQLAHLQTTMDPDMATNVAFAGILAYVGFTTVIGVVAVTTANDQMERVTWAPGLPLIQRWIREDERAAIDRVAVAWGFRETWRRGEEEGEDWENLREWIGRRGMILDSVQLMEGME